MGAEITEVQIFREEAQELLVEIEKTLLELEGDAGSRELVDRLFRAIHTIKGSGAMFGFERIAAFAHRVETVIDAVRSGDIALSKPLIDLVLAAGDRISAMMEEIGNEGETGEEETERIISALDELMAEAGPGPAGGEKKSAKAGKAPGGQGTGKGETRLYRIRFFPEPGIFQRDLDPLAIFEDLAALGELRVTTLAEAVPEFIDLDPTECHLAYDLVLATSADANAIRDAFIFLEKESRLEISQVPEDYVSCDIEPPKLGEILVARGDVQPAALEQILQGKPRLGEQLVQAGMVSPARVESALVEQDTIREARKARQATTIRVASEKLDFLINVVGELVTAQARLEDTTGSTDDLQLTSAVEEVGRLVTELRDNVMSIRMLPVGATFEKFKRLVRDLADQTGKQVEMQVEGGETELDKSMLERLNDPLVHLIRNAVDHGIESPEERLAARKPEKGHLLVKARHVGGSVHLTIQDDGAGIDTETLVGKAVKLGVLREGDSEAMTREEKLALIFHPGLSTAKKVTNVSGRGVGMDVVRTEISKLTGKLEIDSVLGRGTAITVKLPLTMAIIDGLLVRAKDTKYVIPVNCIRECLELTEKEIAAAHGRRLVRVRDQVVPYIRLRELFDDAPRDQEIEQMIVVEHDNAAVGIVIDQIYGDHQTVIKSLGKAFAEARGITGATILGDGTVALITDVAQLVNCAMSEETARLERG